MKGEYLSLETAKQLVDLKNRIENAIEFIEKDYIAIGKYDKIKLIKILRGTYTGR